ncbi:two-component regulator propeller domain-containing protein [Carboxylicivirga sp. RSCT41]|uniref:two-component regulator propeller domain-containing protein n=1 Tax=Carboxylicivirga agarovorans TaxID=3417570 RepID=UPI003D33E567
MNKVCFIILFALSTGLCFAQDSPMRFQSITINDGLSLSSVYCIKKDSKGFMWFGTEDGLNRYDGYHFTIYRTDVKNPNSICYKWIEHIEEDADGQLWFGSRNGLSHFNPASEVFTNFRTNQDNSINNDTITCLQAYNSSMVAGTKNGLSLFDNKSLACLNYSTVDEVNAIVPYGEDLLIAASNGLFLLKSDMHLEKIMDQFCLNVAVDYPKLYVASMKYVRVVDISASETNGQDIIARVKGIESIALDQNSHLWINAREGLWCKHVDKGWLKKMAGTDNTTNSLAINTGKSLLIDATNTVWYATHGDGLFVINKHLELTKCIHNPTDNESINQNAFNCIYEDENSGNIWLGTYGAGINIFHPAANKFDLIKHNPLNANSLPSNFIWSVFEAQDSCLWIGTNDKGLCRYCPKSNSFVTFSNIPDDDKSLSHNTVREVFEDSDGTIWVGTNGGGLNRYDPSESSFTKYMVNKGDDASISDNSVRVVFEDSRGQLWVGTQNGLNLFDKQKGTFRQFYYEAGNPNSLSNNFVYASIIEDKEGQLWIGTYGGGLNKLDPDSFEFTHYTSQAEDGKRLSNNIVFSLHQDNKGRIWVGTNEGLNVLHPQTGDVKVLGMKDGLPNEVIYSILPDERGDLWLSTNHGICCINPTTLKCRNFDVSDGLQSNEFNGGAFHKGASGKMYFGGVYGLNVLNPGLIKTNEHVSQAVITRLEILGNEVKVSPLIDAERAVVESDSQFVIARNISYMDHIELDYSQRFFAIEYSGLNHLFPGKTQYAFQLSPMDKKWNKAGLRNYVSFANVKPGNYEFRIINTNSDGIWSDRMARLGITIKPPFWQTTWFLILELIVVLVIIVFIYRFLLKVRMNKLLKAQNEKIRHTNQQLKLSQDNLRQMNITKDKFFSIISHDLKNPFTSLMSISNMLNDSYEIADDEDKRDAVTRINHSVKSIYLLLENLLTWSRSQRGKIEFETKPFNLSALINENINLYTPAAGKKQISLVNEFPEELMARGDRNTINTIIRNISGNALKFTSSGGKVFYSVADSDGMLKISIRDTGVGIAPEDQDRLFCIDKKLKTDGTEGEKGTGLGLIICKEFAEKNGGEIGVVSESGKGSEFWFTVKKVL